MAHDMTPTLRERLEMVMRGFADEQPVGWVLKASPALTEMLDACAAVAREAMAMKIKRAVLPFCSNALMISLVVFNTWSVSHNLMLSALLCQIGLGLAWTISVRSVTGGGWPERIGYILGGCAGSLLGMTAARIVTSGTR